jgi:3-dehydroquinate synthetase
MTAGAPGAEAREGSRGGRASRAPDLREERVRLPGRETRVRIGAGARRLLARTLDDAFPTAERVGWLVDATVARLWERADGLEPPAGRRAARLLLPAGEAAKERSVLAAAEDLLLELRREEPVIVVGGGAALDAGGLAAALAHRGHPWIAVPTTVLAMADASVGGKVAINHARGKNLLGTFHPPVEVLADLDVLATLPARERAAGLAEVWKAGCVADADLCARLAEGPPEGPALADALARAVAVKARLVEADERDHGARRALNYGHTVGHALERVGLDLLHGEAVAIGMGVAARLARARGLLDAAWVGRQRDALVRLGLPVDLPPAVDRRALLERLGADKKRRAGALHTFVLPRATGVVVVEDVREAEVQAALAASLPEAGRDVR